MVSATEEWEGFLREINSDVLNSLRKVWFRKEPLTIEEQDELKVLYSKYPMDAPSFEVWMKQRLRQKFEGLIKRGWL